jgi:hypothetical protein
MTTYLPTLLYRCLLVLGLAYCLWPGRLMAQPGTYSATDSLLFMLKAQEALDSYQAKLNDIIDPEIVSSSEVQWLKNVVLQDFFFKPTIPVYNALNRETYTGTEYLAQFHSKRYRMALDLRKATYRLTQLADKRLVIIAVVDQLLTNTKLPSQTMTEPLVYHLNFMVETSPFGYAPKEYRLVKIEKNATTLPPGRLLPTGIDIDSLLSKNRDLSWVARRLARSIKEQLPTGTQSVYLEKFVYSNSKMTGKFSDELLTLLRHRLKTDENIGSLDASGKVGIGIRGRFAEKVNNVEIAVELFEQSSGKQLKSLRPNTDLPMTWVYTKGLRLKPDGSEQAEATEQTLANSQASQPATPQPDKLAVKVGTSLKSRNNEFWENDTMYVNVRLNKPGFVRLLYIDAKGTPTLLWRDYEVKPGSENKDVVFPEPFVCVPPFGRETLVAVASTSPFCPVQTTRNDYGVDILTGTLAEAMKNTRCTESRGVARAPQLAETRVSFTTRKIK